MAPTMSLKITILEMLARVLLAVRQDRATECDCSQPPTPPAHTTASPAPPSDNNDSDEALAAARPLLGAAETDRAWSEGLAMTLTDAIEFAQHQRA